MNSADVYKCLKHFIRNHEHQFQNTYVHAWEADVFSVTKTRYSHEIEIKVSRADFFADFKKEKHQLFSGFKSGWKVVRIGEGHELDRKDHRIKYPCSHISVRKLNHMSCPNKLYFACPDGLIKADEIPEYAGLIYVGPAYLLQGGCSVVKKAPYLHKDPFQKEILFSKYYWGYINQKREIADYKSDADRYRKKITELEKELNEFKRPLSGLYLPGR
jgi:hypothetical protein